MKLHLNTMLSHSLTAVLVLTAASSVSPLSQQLQLQLPATVEECARGPQVLLNQQPAVYTLRGSTSAAVGAAPLDADSITDYQMYFVERQTACLLQVTLENNVAAVARLMGRAGERSWLHAHTQPGLTGHVQAPALRRYGPLVLENVVVDLGRLVASGELAVSGLELELPRSAAGAPTAVTLPALRMRVTSVFQLQPRGPQSVGVQLVDVAVRVSVLEPPHLTGYGDGVVSPVFDVLDFLVERRFNSTLDTFEPRFMNRLAVALKSSINLALTGIDIGFLQPYSVLQVLEMTKTSEQIRKGVWGFNR